MKATPLPIVNTIPALTDTPESAMPHPAPTQPPAVPAVLPAPLYYLAPNGATQQIWRIETDGTTRTPITQEAIVNSVFFHTPTKAT